MGRVKFAERLLPTEFGTESRDRILLEPQLSHLLLHLCQEPGFFRARGKSEEHKDGPHHRQPALQEEEIRPAEVRIVFNLEHAVGEKTTEGGGCRQCRIEDADAAG